MLYDFFKGNAPLIPAIESTEAQDLKPKEILADSLYGSDDNCERAKEHNVELITLPDIQSGYESTLSATLGALSGANFLFGCGVLEQGLTMDYAKLLMDAK